MRELWGTFSVSDHLEDRAFVADVILYDRLVIPCPPAAEPEQWGRWQRRKWNPTRQRKFLQILRDRGLVVEVPWDKARRKVFHNEYAAAQAADYETTNAFAMTARQLLPYEELEKLQVMPVRPKTVAAYASRERMKRRVPVRTLHERLAKDPDVRNQELAMILAYDILVPDTSDRASQKAELKLLKRAAKVAARPKFRERRAAFHEWIDKAVTAQYTDAEAMAQMNDLLGAYNNEIKAAKITTRVEQAFVVAGTGLTVGGHFFPPLWLGAVAVAPARYVVMKDMPAQPFQNAPPAMLHEAQRALKRRWLFR